jgi:hypothetical protein
MSRERIISYLETEFFVYPSINDPNFNQKLNLKQEFEIVPSDESAPLIDGLRPSQYNYGLYVNPNTPYLGTLAFWDAGSGKTGIVKAVHSHFQGLLLEGKRRKPAIILLPSSDMIPTIRSLILDLIKDENFKLFNSSYFFSSFEIFLKALPQRRDAIRDLYSDRDIFIDEIHTLKEESKIGEESSGKLYRLLHKFLHSIERSRITLLSGTPIWDKANEIAQVFNLILPLKDQFPVGKKFNKEFFDDNGNMINQDTFISKIKGHVSYFRKRNSSPKIEEGITLPFTKFIKVVPVIMDPFQAKVCRETLRSEGLVVSKDGKKKIKLSHGRSNFYSLAKDASNFVYPKFNDNGEVIGSIVGNQGFQLYCVKRVTSYVVINGKVERRDAPMYMITNEFFRREIRTNLKKYSIKFWTVVQGLLENRNDNAFVNCETIAGSGAILLGLCLIEFGFKWINKINPLFPDSQERRFTIVSSLRGTIHQKNQIVDIFDSFNSYENRYSDRLQVIIGGDKISHAYTFKNVRRTYTVTPHWTLSNFDQAEARTIRFKSLENLPENERYTHIYRLCAIEENLEEETIDVLIYRRIEKKEYQNIQILHLLKVNSFDCFFNKKNNMNPEDKDFSRDCDFGPCEYTCDGEPNNESRDLSSYKVLYSDKERMKIKKEIQDELTRSSRFKLSPDYLFLRSLVELMEERPVVYDRDGFAKYLINVGDNMILTSELGKFDDVLYDSYFILQATTDLNDLIEGMELNSERNLLPFCTNPTQEGFDRLNFYTKILVMEHFTSLVSSSSDFLNPSQEKKFSRIIYRFFARRLYRMNDGTLVHNLYNEVYTGVSYSASSKTIRFTGRMRMLESTIFQWISIVDPEREIEYANEIKELKLETQEELLEEGDYPFIGIISSLDHSFRIRKKKKGIRGKRCIHYPTDELIDFVVKTNSFPPLSKATIDTSLDVIKSELKNINGSEDYLRNIYNLRLMKTNELCSYLQDWMKKNGLLIEE